MFKGIRLSRVGAGYLKYSTSYLCNSGDLIKSVTSYAYCFFRGLLVHRHLVLEASILLVSDRPVSSKRLSSGTTPGVLAQTFCDGTCQ